VTDTDNLPLIEASDLRKLLDATCEDPVLYLKESADGGDLGVWAEAYVPHPSIIVRQSELLDMLTGCAPEPITTDDLKWAAEQLQDNVEQAEPCPDND
jgi:hypothetical protein